MSKCEDCDAFQRRSEKNGVCRANPPSVLVFGMEKVNVPGIQQRGHQGMRPITGTGFPEVTNDGWCRQFKAIQPSTAFNPALMKPVGEAQSLNGSEYTEGSNSNELQG